MDRLFQKSTANVLRNKALHTLPGIAYGKRGEYLDAQVLLAGQIFTHEGHAFPNLKEDIAWVTLCLMNSRLFQYGTEELLLWATKHSGYVNCSHYSGPFRCFGGALQPCKAGLRHQGNVG